MNKWCWPGLGVTENTCAMSERAAEYSPWRSNIKTLAFGYRVSPCGGWTIERNKLATVVDFPEPVEPRIAQCRVVNDDTSMRTFILSALDNVPITICPNDSE